MVGESKNEKKRQQELELIRRVIKGTKSAVVTGPAAARLYGLSTRQWVEQVDLVMVGKSVGWGKERQYPDRVYRSSQLPETNWTIRDGVRITSIIRTLFDSYRYHGRTEALVQVESAKWKWPELTSQNLLQRCASLPRAKGLKGFRELIEYAGADSMSALETLVRDQLLQAIARGELMGVETIEFQVGFTISDQNGEPRTIWADALINGFIFVESDGAEKTSGVMGSAEEALRWERHREREMQNAGAFFQRVTWKDAGDGRFVNRIQRQIDLHPGVHSLPSRLSLSYREWEAQMLRRSR